MGNPESSKSLTRAQRKALKKKATPKAVAADENAAPVVSDNTPPAPKPRNAKPAPFWGFFVEHQGLITIITSAVTAAILLNQTVIIGQQADIAAAALAIQQRASELVELQQRASLQVEIVEFAATHPPSPDVHLEVTVTNGGLTRSPWSQHYMRYSRVVPSIGSSEFIPEPGHHSDVVRFAPQATEMFVGNRVPLTRLESRPADPLAAYGWVAYTDVFGDVRLTKFCRELQAGRVTEFPPFPGPTKKVITAVSGFSIACADNGCMDRECTDYDAILDRLKSLPGNRIPPD